MRRFGSILAVFMLVILLVVTEIVIIRSASKYEPQVKVVFAKTGISERTVITPDMLELRAVDLSFVHRMSLRNISDAVSKRAGTDIEAGEMLLSGRLEAGDMEAIEVKDLNKKLFSVEFKGDQANGWWLMTDQTVDIIYVPDENPAAGSPDAARAEGNGLHAAAPDGIPGVGDKVRILKNIRIAALIDESGRLLKNAERATLPRYVSFEVTDGQAGLLAYAKSHGRLELSVIPERRQ
jgi:Flp pilus assembly protein CpaB